MSLHEDYIIKIGGMLFADVFAFEMPRLVCCSMDCHLYSVVAVLAVDTSQRKKQLEEKFDQLRKRSLFLGNGYVILEIFTVLWPVIPLFQKYRVLQTHKNIIHFFIKHASIKVCLMKKT